MADAIVVIKKATSMTQTAVAIARWPDFYCHKETAGKTCFGAREKDVVESYLNRQICHGKLTLQQAQEILRTDWFAEYVKIKGLARPN